MLLEDSEITVNMIYGWSDMPVLGSGFRSSACTQRWLSNRMPHGQCLHSPFDRVTRQAEQESAIDLVCMNFSKKCYRLFHIVKTMKKRDSWFGRCNWWHNPSSGVLADALPSFQGRLSGAHLWASVVSLASSLLMAQGLEEGQLLLQWQNLDSACRVYAKMTNENIEGKDVK